MINKNKTNELTSLLPSNNGSSTEQQQQNDNEYSQSETAIEGAKVGTIFSGIVNLSNTIMGAGLLGLPGAFAGTGYLGGLGLIVLSAVLSAHGLILLSQSAQRVLVQQQPAGGGVPPPSSFYTVAHAAVPSYTILIDFAVALKCFGVATGYLITISDSMVDVMGFVFRTTTEETQQQQQWMIQCLLSRQLWVFVAVLAVLPVSFYKTLDALKKASSLALICVLLLALSIVAYANGLFVDNPCGGSSNGTSDNNDDGCRGAVVAFTDLPTTFSKVPIFIFAFTCHQNIFPIVNELQHRTQPRLNRIIYASIGFALVLFMVVAFEGYVTFGSHTRGDILLNYPHDDTNVTVLRVCIAVMLILHYPLQLDPGRRCLTSLINVITDWWSERQRKRRYNTKHPAEDTKNRAVLDANDADDDAGKRRFSSSSLFKGITVAFLLLSFVVAMIIDDLGIVLACVGATGSILVSYVLPGLIYMKLHHDYDRTKIAAILQLVMGCILIPIAFYYVVHK